MIRRCGLLALVIAAGAFLRFLVLGHQSFWYDESVSAQLASVSLADLVRGRVKDLGNPPLHSILLHLWAHLFGWREASLRSMSALAGALSIPLVYDLARRLVGKPAALAAAALFALSPLQIYFAQEARTYALVTMLVLVSTDLLVCLSESPRRPGLWIGFTLSTFLSLYAHYFAAFVILAQIVWVIAQHRGNRALLVRLGAALLTAALLFLVWIPSLIAQMTTKGNLGRAADSWYLHLLSTPLVFGVGTTLLWKDTVTPLRLGAAAVAVLAFGFATLSGARALRENRAAFVLLLAWLLFPVLIPLVVSLTLFPFFYVRYSLPATPAFCILAGVGLWHLSGRARWGTMVAMAVTSGLSLFFYFTTLVKHDWRSAEAWVHGQAQPGDVVVFDADIGETPFAYYGRDETRVRLLPPPAKGERHFYGVSPRHEPTHLVDQQLFGAPRVWFVYSDPKVGAGTYYATRFASDFHLVSARKFRGIEISLLEPKR